jgi:hypothetical protein
VCGPREHSKLEPDSGVLYRVGTGGNGPLTRGGNDFREWSFMSLTLFRSASEPFLVVRGCVSCRGAVIYPHWGPVNLRDLWGLGQLVTERALVQIPRLRAADAPIVQP